MIGVDDVLFVGYWFYCWYGVGVVGEFENLFWLLRWRSFVDGEFFYCFVVVVGVDFVVWEGLVGVYVLRGNVVVVVDLGYGFGDVFVLDVEGVVYGGGEEGWWVGGWGVLGGGGGKGDCRGLWLGRGVGEGGVGCLLGGRGGVVRGWVGGGGEVKGYCYVFV